MNDPPTLSCQVIDNGLETAHVPYSYGFAIIALTILVKAATFPLSQKQVASSVAIQALQPRVKEIQAKYAAEPETLQLETARLYKEAGVNPLAGCLPTLATIPIFIGLYKALSRAADEGLGQESFFWIPDLSGPTTMTERATGAGMSWLFPFVDGAPPIGWAPAGAYLIMPLLLIASQYASMKIMQPDSKASQDPSVQQSQAILQFLPLMIGWFSLNVPSGLTLYWFVNNILSTAQQLYLKSTTTVKIPEMSTGSSGSSAASTPFVRPKEERVKRTSGQEVGARRGKRDDDQTIDVEATTSAATSSPATSVPASAAASQSSSGSRGKGGKGEKFRALKAREAASKASVLSSEDGSSN
jgi:YidC/Oxa1 family membrane protein insertase